MTFGYVSMLDSERGLFTKRPSGIEGGPPHKWIPVVRAIEEAMGPAPEDREAFDRAYLAAATTGTGWLHYDATPEGQGRAVRVRFRGGSTAKDVFDFRQFIDPAGVAIMEAEAAREREMYQPLIDLFRRAGM
jgi:hypothetical protein